ncbi:MAG: glycine cleavage system protein R [Gammaproteobacteria bacterium]|nr:glycine cleavage system protein R [Gammaproteobacteria bacterium]
MSSPAKQYLVISALGQDRPGIVKNLTQPISESGANILDSRMTILGGEFAVLMMVEGGWDTIAKLEAQLPALEQRLGLTIVARRTTSQQPQANAIPYSVNVVALDHPGIVNQLADFFSGRHINIQDLFTDCYNAAHTGTPMFTATLVVNIPGDISIARLREEFFDFCDSLNLDGIIEPAKG